MGDPVADFSEERMRILEMIEQGRISADEGLGLIQALNAAADRVDDRKQEAEPQDFEFEMPSKEGELLTIRKPSQEVLPPELYDAGQDKPEAIPESTSPDFVSAQASRKWKRWWIIPLFIGMGIALFGGLFMFLAQQSSGIGFWFLCASIPFMIGLILIVLSVQSRKMPWLHLRIQQPPGETPERINFSFPLPVNFGAWVLRTFGRWIPGMRDQNWDQILLALGQTANSDAPLIIQVDEPETGEKVEIFIG